MAQANIEAVCGAVKAVLGEKLANNFPCFGSPTPLYLMARGENSEKPLTIH
jgi:hypothetical protein